MKKTIKTFGFIAIVVIITIGFVACDNGTTTPKPGIAGTYTQTDSTGNQRLVFSGFNISVRGFDSSWVEDYRGTFSTTGNNISIHLTWGRTSPINQIFTGTFSLSGDTLTLSVTPSGYFETTYPIKL